MQSKAPLTPDRPQVKRPPPSLQITSNFLVFMGFHMVPLLKRRVWWCFRAGPNGPSTRTCFWQQNSTIPPKVTILLYRGHSWLVSKAFIDTSWQLTAWNFGDKLFKVFCYLNFWLVKLIKFVYLTMFIFLNQRNFFKKYVVHQNFLICKIFSHTLLFKSGTTWKLIKNYNYGRNL